MSDLGLYNYIKNELAKGNAKEQISAAILAGGQIKQGDIDAAFADVAEGILPIANQNNTYSLPPEPALSNFNFSYAGFWIRVVAYIIDGFTLGIPFIILFNKSDRSSFLLKFSVGLVSWLYFTLLESSSKQATLGKMAMGLKVTDLNGNRISWARANGRFFAKILSAIILYIGYFMVAFTQKKQGLHDMLAKTFVLRARNGTESSGYFSGPTIAETNQSDNAAFNPSRSQNSKNLWIIGGFLILALVVGYQVFSQKPAAKLKLTDPEIIQLNKSMDAYEQALVKYEHMTIDSSNVESIWNNFADEVTPLMQESSNSGARPASGSKAEIDYYITRYNALAKRETAIVDKMMALMNQKGYGGVKENY